MFRKIGSVRNAAAAVRLPLRRAVRRSFVATGVGLGLAALVTATGTTVPLTGPQLELIRWTGGGGGTARALAQSVSQPAAPTPVVNNRQVTVSWSTTTMSGGTAVPGYVVRRFDQNGVAQTVGAGCTGTVSGTSCVETDVPTGQWRYSVQGKAGNFWVGAESDRSAIVTVANAKLAFTSSTTITSLPATLSGTISGFALLESLTFRLDSSTGPVLTATPANASLVGGGTVSVTIPAGTTDAPHSVFVVGGLGSTAAAAINIVIPPKLVSLSMRDVNANGKVDQVLATFDDTLAPYAAGLAPWTLANVPSGATLQSVSVSGAVATLTLAEGSGAASTAAGGFTIALAANSAGIRDVNEHPSSFSATAVTDGAAPAVLSLVMQDSTANGKIDGVVATFSEPLATYSAGTAPWTVSNVPSGGTLASVSVSTPTVTLAITEGSGAATTAVGSFTVALAANSNGVRDAAGNQTAFAARAPADGATPVRTGLEMFDVNKNGKVDRVVATFSETLAVTTAAGPWTLTNVPSAGVLNDVSVTGATVTLAISEGAGAANTAVGTFSVALAANAAGVRDASGNMASFAAVAPADKAAPAFTVLALQDAGGVSGKVDRLVGTLSEASASYTAGNAPWTLANVPSGGSLPTNAVTVSGTSVTVTITEGAGVADTSVGSMTVTLAASATGIRDSAGNLTSFSAVAPADAAKPVVVSITDTNGTTDGLIQSGDTLSVTFSEALLPATVPASTTVTLTDPNGSANDTLTVTGITSGARGTGSNGYVGINNASAAFANSVVTLGNGNKTVTITVGPACAGTGCASLAAATGTPTLSYVAAATLTDAAGNTPVTTARAQAIKLF